MRKIILIIAFLLLNLISFAQKQDSAAIAEQNKKIIQIVNTTSLKEFQEWLRNNLVAAKYEDFVMWYNAFVEYKYQQSLKEKPKTTK